MAKTVVGVFRSINHAEAVVRELQNRGFGRGNISLITRDTRQAEEVGRETGLEDVTEGMAAGAGVGAVLGGAAGLLVGLGALAIPGVGPIVAAGPIAAALGGAGLGAATGGIAGALVDLGIPDKDAELYLEGVRRGGTLVSVRCEDQRAMEAADIMEGHEPVDIRRSTADWGELDAWGQVQETPTSGQFAFERVEPDFRQHYDRLFSGSGRPYEAYRQAYYYGYQLHHELGCNGDCNWEEVRPEARRDWESRYPETAWHEVQDAVRHAFEYRHY